MLEKNQAAWSRHSSLQNCSTGHHVHDITATPHRATPATIVAEAAVAGRMKDARPARTELGCSETASTDLESLLFQRTLMEYYSKSHSSDLLILQPPTSQSSD